MRTSGHRSAGAGCAGPTRPDRRRAVCWRLASRGLSRRPGAVVPSGNQGATGGIASAGPLLPSYVTDSTVWWTTAAGVPGVALRRGGDAARPNVTYADPLLVSRRHVDFLRIRTAIRCTGR